MLCKERDITDSFLPPSGGFFICDVTMPISAPKKCTQVGCHALVRDGSGRCDQHQKPAWVKKVTAVKRITGRRLQALRAKLFTEHPICVVCGIRASTERDHITPLFEGGLDDETNEQALCGPCHEEKSIAESKKARWGG